jgi:multiple sugar transport system ATP-binding protein
MNFFPAELNGHRLRLPIGDVSLPDELRRELESEPGGGHNGVIAGLRPEDFEDAAIVSDRSRGHTFKAKVDVVESMGSEQYAYFTVASERVSTTELDELAQEAGQADLPHTEGIQVAARLDAASKVREGQEAELWFDPRRVHLFDPETGRSLRRGSEPPREPSTTEAAAGPELSSPEE